MNDEIDTTVPDDPAGNQLADNKSHAVANLKVVASELDDEFHGMVFQDSDVYKWLEEAAYALAYHPDPELKALCDRTVTSRSARRIIRCSPATVRSSSRLAGLRAPAMFSMLMLLSGPFGAYIQQNATSHAARAVAAYRS